MKLSGHNLSCERGGRLVFSGLDFSVSAGEMLILRGANGAGKTSLLRVIAGLNEVADGELVFEGGTDDHPIASHCQFIAHQDAFKPALTVEENLQFWADFFVNDYKPGGVQLALEAFSLDALAGFSSALLSAGQKRRLALGRLAMIERPVWLLDEPTVGLDTASVKQLQTLMLGHLDNNGLIIATTHIDLGIKQAKVLDFAALKAAVLPAAGSSFSEAAR